MKTDAPVPTTLVIKFGNFERSFTVDGASIVASNGKVTVIGELSSDPTRERQPSCEDTF
jgi:hypothetical protein